MNKIPRLLSPAGNYESMVAAVANGADAVYLGLNAFNARESAQNFNEDNIENAISYCHNLGVSVYVTLNTLIYNREMKEALRLAQIAVNAKADSIILQDIGLFSEIKKNIANPPPLTASTQLAVHNLSGVRALEKLGFSRVVLARELSLEQIKCICQKTDMEIEIFIHGAICKSVSGACLMSSVIGGRSGNRGRCAQPCRLAYSYDKFSAKKQLLSPKDLCAYELMEEIINSGVHSLKIEGRLKSPEYCATVTRKYREILDNISLLKDKNMLKQNMAELKSAYAQRGYNNGYFHPDR